MNLLDTHVLIWLEQGDRQLGPLTLAHIINALSEGDAAVSAISFWEVAMRVQKGRLNLSQEPDAWRRDLIEKGLVEIAIDGNIATKAGSLIDIHGDPADRLIIATALEGHELVTADRRILDWPGPLSRIDARL